MKLRSQSRFVINDQGALRGGVNPGSNALYPAAATPLEQSAFGRV